MVISEPSSPSSPFSWRLRRRKDHHNAPGESTLSPNSPRKPATVPVGKEQSERNLLIQRQKEYMGKLEARRKDFRRQTQLKTWPLQDMAMDHLDHLLGHNANHQFHGGDYLSTESSSSSVSSVETSKQRLRPQSTIKNKDNSNNKTDQKQQSKENNENESSNQEPPIIIGADDSVTTVLQNQQQQHASPLWSMEPRIFATEKGQHGKRKYLVGEFGRLADWYWRNTAPSSRHLYEVIREGSPCRLYFDLEFSRLHNPLVPELKLLQELEEELTTELQLQFGTILPTLQSSQIVNLDSSNEKKFSRHWIVHLLDSRDSDEVQQTEKQSERNRRQEFLFKDAPTVGRFVKRMVGRLAEDMAAEDDGGDFAKKRPALAQHLFVKTKDPHKKSCVIDLGVYTRNRLFRCVGSSKKGKATILQPVFHEKEELDPTTPAEIGSKDRNNDTDDENEDDSSSAGSDTGSDRCYFPLSIPCQKKTEIESSSSQSSSSNVISSMDAFIVANDWEPYAQALADSMVVPLKNQPFLSSNSSSSLSTENKAHHDKHTTRILEVEDGSKGSSLITKFTDTSRKTSPIMRRPPTTLMARQRSPLPSLDHYVSEHLSSRGGVRGSIRAWSIEYGRHRDMPVSMTYQIQQNRFCEIIGRAHKSNKIYWTIDLHAWTCTQGCWDPECFGRGRPLPISNNVVCCVPVVVAGKKGEQRKQPLLDQIKQEFASWQEEEFEKALMELNLNDIVVAAPPAPPANHEKLSASQQLDPRIHQRRDANKEEEEFEKALMELNLDDIVAAPPPPANHEKVSALQLDPRIINQRWEANEEALLNNEVDDDLSDAALLQAIVDNPEMFP